MLKQMPKEIEQEYYRKISKIESGDNPKAKAKTSSASGRFQFIKSTWIGLGYSWSEVFNDAKQWEAIEKFTAQNEAALIKGGCAINHATLYGAHFLGVAGFLRVMRGVPSASVATVTEPSQRKANPSILNGTVQDFCDWLEKKTGDKVTKRYGANAAAAQPLPFPPPPDIPVTDPEIVPSTKASGPMGLIIFALIIAVVAAVVYFQMR